MYYRKIPKIIFLMLMISTLATANDAKARAYYLGAQEAYNAHNYSAALTGLEKTKELLGGSNAAISALETKIYYKQGNYKQAQASLDIFLSQKSHPDLFKEMSSYLIKIDEAIKIEQGKKAKEEKKRKDQALLKEVHRHVKYFGDDKNKSYYSWAITMLSDGSVILIGSIDSEYVAKEKVEPWKRYIYIIGLDRDGQKIFERTIGKKALKGYNTYSAASIDSDHFFIGGRDWKSGSAFLIKMDRSGKVLWNRIYKSTWNFTSMDVLKDKNLLVVDDVRVHKIDSNNGDIIWGSGDLWKSKEIYPRNIIDIGGNSYYGIGKGKTRDEEKTTVLFSMQSDGSIKVLKSFGKTEYEKYEFDCEICKTGDHEFVVVFKKDRKALQVNKYKTSDGFSLEWTKQYTTKPEEHITSVKQNKVGNIAIYLDRLTRFIYIDNHGKTLTHTYTNIISPRANDMVSLDNNEFGFVGTARSIDNSTQYNEFLKLIGRYEKRRYQMGYYKIDIQGRAID